jgi:hypothetical protein
MDANRRQSGIQQLLAVEQEAQQIVNAARAGMLNYSLAQRITNQAGDHRASNI